MKWVNVQHGYHVFPIEVPFHCHKGDWLWLDKQLQLFNPQERYQVAQRYSQLYLKTLDQVDAPHKKYNTARRICNIKLRRIAQNCRDHMKAKVLHDYFIKPTLDYLAIEAQNINGKNSRQFMLAVAAQESHCGEYFKQLGNVENGGEGIWQVEQATKDDLNGNYLNYRPELKKIVDNFFSPWQKFPLIQSIEYNCAIARLCVYRYKEPMPPFDDRDSMWDLYKKRYNSSKGAAKKKDWDDNWHRFVEGVEI